MSPIPTELLSAVKGTYEGLADRLREIPYEWREEGLAVSGRFFYLAFRDGAPTLDEFIQYLEHRIIPFCITRRERAEKRLKFEASGDERHIQELVTKAQNLFSRARQRKRDQGILTSGEPGELILFVILEGFVGAPQLVCKMYLKTSEAMPVHGADGIHMTAGSTSGAARFLWGESKLFSEASAGLDEICTSIKAFLEPHQGRSHRDREIDILRDHMDVDNQEHRQAILDYFDPYSADSNQREEAFACFLGFDFSVLGDLASLERDEREAHLQAKYSERIESACRLFASKIRSHPELESLRIDFYLMPFADVNDLSTRFLARLGLT